MEHRRGAHAAHGRDGALGAGFEYTSGPIPDPTTLGRYEALDPTLPGRIVAMAEAETYRHHDRLDAVVGHKASMAKRGQWMAFVLTVVMILASVAFFALGKPIGGVAFISIPLAFLVRSFLQGRED